jgi:predicted Zn-dependent protease with MMP-like domain
MSPLEFDAVVERAIRKIPARYRRRLQNVVFIVEQEPPRSGLLGLYHGRPMPLRSVNEPFAMPDKITIYQGPHERMSRTFEELERHVHDTVWHEIAHYFGLNEAEVRRAEQRRARHRQRKSNPSGGRAGGPRWRA